MTMTTRVALRLTPAQPPPPVITLYHHGPRPGSRSYHGGYGHQGVRAELPSRSPRFLTRLQVKAKPSKANKVSSAPSKNRWTGSSDGYDSAKWHVHCDC